MVWPPVAGGAAAALLEEGDVDVDVTDADPLAERLAEPVADPDCDDVAFRDEALPETDDAVWLLLELTELDTAEDAVIEEARVTPAPPVGMRLSVVLAGRTSELDGEGSSTKSAMILISVHWSPIDSSYRLPNSPLMHRNHLVEPPIASELFWHTEKPPV